MWVHGYPNDYYPNKRTIPGNWIEKQTGVEIEWEFTHGDFSQKITVLLNDREFPDAVSGGDDVRILQNAGAVIPLNDLIETYGEKRCKNLFYKSILILIMSRHSIPFS
jgi:ABC-type glycerol-3-phosphate transport system substrate-binding protein